MRKATFILTLLIASMTVLAQAPKDVRIKEIRAAYAQAKDKIAQNGKNGQSPKDMRIVMNQMEDEEVYLYDMEEVTYYFDETVEDNIVTKHPYFIIENWSNHGHMRYREVLIEPKSQQVMFCFMHGETDGGYTVESRYYYDATGLCIEEKHNTSNPWTTSDSEKGNAEGYLKVFGMVNHDGYFTPLDSDRQQNTTKAKAERMKHIRSTYAQAKDRIAQNAKKEDPDELVITLHEFGDDRPPRTTTIQFAITPQDCYFISSHATAMGSDTYTEYLFEPGNDDLIFSYCRAREEGEQYEWRYYYDENGTCIETKSNLENTDDGFHDKQAAKDLLAIFRFLISSTS